ncbi:MAG: hypothetical protein U0457_19360 [Candidatus Sericytochromatia bacterium]
MLKKSVAWITVSCFIVSCNIFTNNNSTTGGILRNVAGGKFNIKSTTNPNEIKKNFLPVTRISKQKGKEREKDDNKKRVFTFNASQADLKRSFILNITNGSGGGERVGNLEVFINGTQVIFNHDEDIDNTDDINKIKKKLCGDDTDDRDGKERKKDDDKKFKIKHDKDDKNDKNKPSCELLISNFFNKKTDALSVGLPNIKEGVNSLEVRIKDERDKFALDISIDGFLRSSKIPGASHSELNIIGIREDFVKNGQIKIKFLEGLKVRIENNSNGEQILVDKNGLDLTSLNRLIKSYKIKLISNITNEPEDLLDQIEQIVENKLNRDEPNLNLFKYLNFAPNIDHWKIIDEIKKLPYIEEAYPNLNYGASGYFTNDPYRSYVEEAEKPKPVLDEWLKKTKIKSDDKCLNPGAWEYNRGKGIKIAILDSIPQVSQVTYYDAKSVQKIDDTTTKKVVNTGLITHEDFLDSTGKIPSNLHFISNLSRNYLGKGDTIDVANKLTAHSINHSTASVGVVGAVANNNKGLAGIANEAEIYSIATYGKTFKDNKLIDIDPELSGNGNTLISGSEQINTYNNTIDSIILAKKLGVDIIGIENTPIVNGVGYLPDVEPDIKAIITRAIYHDNIIIIGGAGNAPCDRMEKSVGIETLKNSYKNCSDNFRDGYDVRYEYELKNHQISTIKDSEDKPIHRISSGLVVVGGVDLNGNRMYSELVPSALGIEMDKFITLFPTGISGDYEGITIEAPATDVFSPAYDKSSTNHYMSTNRITTEYPTLTSRGSFGGVSAGIPIIAGVSAIWLSEYKAKIGKPNSGLVDTSYYAPQVLNLQMAYHGFKGRGDNKVGNMINAYEFLKENFGEPNKGCSFSLESINIGNNQTADTIGNGGATKVTPGGYIAAEITSGDLKSKIGDISILAGKVRMPLLKFVENYAIYGIPADILNNPQIQQDLKNKVLDVIIENKLNNTTDPNQAPLMVLQQALEIVAWKVGIKVTYDKNHPIEKNYPAIESGKTLDVRRGDIINIPVVNLNPNNPIKVSSKSGIFKIIEKTPTLITVEIPKNAYYGIQGVDIYEDNGHLNGLNYTIQKAINVLEDPIVQVNNINVFPQTISNGVLNIPAVWQYIPAPVVPGDKIAIPLTKFLYQDLANYTVSVAGRNLNLLEIVQNYAIYGIPNDILTNNQAQSSILGTLQDIIIKNNLGEPVQSLKDALKLVAIGIGLNPSYPNSLPTTSQFPFLENNISSDPNRIRRIKRGEKFAVSIRGLKDTAQIQVNSGSGDTYNVVERNGEYVVIQVPSNAVLGLQNISVHESNSASGADVLFNNSIEVLPSNQRVLSDFGFGTGYYSVNYQNGSYLSAHYNNVFSFIPGRFPETGSAIYGLRDSSYITFSKGTDGNTYMSMTIDWGGGYSIAYLTKDLGKQDLKVGDTITIDLNGTTAYMAQLSDQLYYTFSSGSLTLTVENVDPSTNSGYPGLIKITGSGYASTPNTANELFLEDLNMKIAVYLIN